MKVSEMILLEWLAILKDKRIMAVLLLIPLGYMLVFGSMYSQGQVEELPTVYLDQNNTALSQQLVQAFDVSSAFSMIGRLHSEEELLDYLESGKAAVALIIPADLDANIKQGKLAEVLTMIDGSNMLISNSATRNASEIVQAFSGAITIKRLEARGLEGNQAWAMHYGYRILYNPGFNYSIFLLLGLFGAVIQQVIFLGVSLAVTREIEQDSWASLLQAYWQQPWKVIYAKCLPYFLIGIFNILLTFGILHRFFHVPMLGELLHLVVLSLVFLLSLMGIGFLASLTAKNMLQATQVTMLIALPSFLLSGFTWPFEAMPSWVSAIGHLLPLSYYLHGMREIAIKGNGWEQITGDLLILASMTILSLLLAILIMYRQGAKQTV